MDFSDFTNKESPKDLKTDKSFIPKYSKEVLKKLKSCVLIVEKAVQDNGLTIEEFHKLRIKKAEDLVKDEPKKMKAIRDSIEKPTEETLLEKVIPKEYFEEYLNGYNNKIGGFVCRAQDVKDLKTYDDYYEALRLDYKPPRFNPETDTSMYAIRFKTSSLELLKIPYSKCLDDEGKEYLPPTTGNGFTSARNNKIVPEYRFSKDITPFYGAEIYEITKDGREILRAVYTKRDKKFIPILHEKGVE